ncbi:hypothetical protein AB0M38_30865 [Streptomyces sp. NPDC051742]|uniref:hypothetical protein n=1 Tax=unclassified Streptomyces TaxID=2593676 RepID=UPI003415BC48
MLQATDDVRDYTPDRIAVVFQQLRQALPSSEPVGGLSDMTPRLVFEASDAGLMAYAAQRHFLTAQACPERDQGAQGTPVSQVPAAEHVRRGKDGVPLVLPPIREYLDGQVPQGMVRAARYTGDEP